MNNLDISAIEELHKQLHAERQKYYEALRSRKDYWTLKNIYDNVKKMEKNFAKIESQSPNKNIYVANFF